MTRQFLPYFNPSRPVFVKINGLQAAGKIWKQGERFNWEFYGTPHDIIQQMFFSDQLYHNEEFEEEVVKRIAVGDGLDELTLDQLHILVENINGKVKAAAKNNREFLQKKCATSKIKDKQIGLIRRWRSSYGDIEK
jgi:hypothetical protein